MIAKGKLFLLLSSFSAREWKAFEIHLKGKNFRQKKEIQDLYRYCKKVCLDNESVEPAKAEILKSVFPGKNLDLSDLRYLESDLVKLIESWWVHLELRDDKVLYQSILLKAMERRALQKPFRNKLAKAFEELEKHPRRDMDYLWQRYRLNNLAFEFASRKENRGIDPGLPAMLDDLKELYLTGSLKYGSILSNLANVVSAPVDPGFMTELMALGESAERSGSPGAILYYHVLLTLAEPEKEEHYQSFLELLESSARYFGHEEVGQLYAFALNYCIKKLNEGRGDYLKKLFVLYQRLLDKKVIFNGPFILQQHFKNIATTAIRLEEYEWTEAFLEAYSLKVSPDARENASTYNFAALYFAKGDYSRAMRLLREVEFTDVYYHVDSKALLLKTYYELEEWEPLLSVIEAFGNYLRRNRMISEYQRKVYWNFLKFAKKLVRKRLGSRKRVGEIQKEMEEVREIADLRWLRLKVKELL